MQLNDFKSTWKHFKLLNTMQPVESTEILSIIEHGDTTSKSQRILLNLVMFLLLVIFCQGG